MNQSGVTNLDWEHAGSKLHLERGTSETPDSSFMSEKKALSMDKQTASSADVSVVAGSGPSAADAGNTPFPTGDSGDNATLTGSTNTTTAALPGELIKSPVVGVFFAAPSPDSDPFVLVGSKIEAGATLCIIEAMKLMNEVTSSIEGEIAEILVENGQRVEFGQTLFRII